MCRDYARQRLGAASQSLRPGSHLSYARVHAEALLRGRSLRLAEPNLKTATRSPRIKKRARVRADLVNEVSQPCGSSVTHRRDTLSLTGLRRVTTRTRRRRARRYPTRRGGLRRSTKRWLRHAERHKEASEAEHGLMAPAAEP